MISRESVLGDWFKNKEGGTIPEIAANVNKRCGPLSADSRDQQSVFHQNDSSITNKYS